MVAIVKFGGKQVVSGGLALLTVISSGGEQDVGPGGTAEALGVIGIGRVSAGGVISGGGFFGATALSGGTEIVARAAPHRPSLSMPAARRSSIPPALPSGRW
jgi:autotransporter passenger strand-loop-strand repeat protein